MTDASLPTLAAFVDALEQIEARGTTLFPAAATLDALEEARVALLGRQAAR